MEFLTALTMGIALLAATTVANPIEVQQRTNSAADFSEVTITVGSITYKGEMGAYIIKSLSNLSLLPNKPLDLFHNPPSSYPLPTSK
jgi:hypothetical protein